MLRPITPLLLLAALPTVAQDPGPDPDGPKVAGTVTILGPREVKAYSFIELNVKESTNIVWHVSPAPVRRRARGGYLYLAGIPGHSYTVTAQAINADFEKKVLTLTNEAEVTVSFGPVDPPPVPPGPTPPPNPPPVDPWAAEMVAAYRADPPNPPTPEKKAWAASYAGLMAAAAKFVTEGDTIDALLSDFKKAAKDVMPPGSLPGVQRVCVAKIVGVAGDDPDRKIDADLKKKLAELFDRLSRALVVEASR